MSAERAAAQHRVMRGLARGAGDVGRPAAAPLVLLHIVGGVPLECVPVASREASRLEILGRRWDVDDCVLVRSLPPLT